MDTLIFIDTNVFLDFYRVRHKGAKLSLLNTIESHKDKIITGDQVEMEFMKNRQKVILDTLKDIRTPEWNTLTTPAFLETNMTAQSIGKSQKEIETKIKTIKRRIGNVLTNPNRNDPIFKMTKKLFSHKSQYNLSREKKIRFEMRRLARKRWILGYPPRKPRDTSIGDAINWEWIIHCANINKSNIVIVSRDSDFGHIYDKSSILNDWLYAEFRRRVSRKRNITLTDRLSHGFESAKIRISKKAKEDEKITINEVGCGET